jgi:hypothetical protein
MRLFLPVLVASLLLWAGSANAAGFTFNGSGSLSSPCSLAGNGADRSCSANRSTSSSSFTVRGQSSADHGLTTNPTAIADMTITFSIPYTVTRTVFVDHVDGGPAEGHFPDVRVNLNVTLSGAAASDNSQSFGGLGNALFTTASFSSSKFGTLGTYSGASASGNSNNPFTRTSPDPAINLGINASGPRRSEGDTDTFGIPLDFRAWDDFQAPLNDAAQGGDGFYDQDFNVVQTFTDTLSVSFRLRAESRPSGSISATGGEAIACAGLQSPLGSFDLTPNCGSGFVVNASVTETGTTVSAVPEPTTLLLLGLGLAGLTAVGVRKRGDG